MLDGHRMPALRHNPSRVPLQLSGWSSSKNKICTIGPNLLLQPHFLNDIFHIHVDSSLKTEFLHFSKRTLHISQKAFYFCLHSKWTGRNSFSSKLTSASSHSLETPLGDHMKHCTFVRIRPLLS